MTWFNVVVEYMVRWFMTFDHDEHDPDSHVVSTVVNGMVTRMS